MYQITPTKEAKIAEALAFLKYAQHKEAEASEELENAQTRLIDVYGDTVRTLHEFGEKLDDGIKWNIRHSLRYMQEELDEAAHVEDITGGQQ